MRNGTQIKRVILLLGLAWLSGGMSKTEAQDTFNWPRLEPSYVNYFYQDDQSYSKKCYEYAFEDAQGMLWLTPCGLDLLVNSTSLFRFDGYRFDPIEVLLEDGKVLESPFIHQMDPQGRLYWLESNDRFFVMDPNERIARHILPRDTTLTALGYWGTSFFEGEIYTLGLTDHGQMILFRYAEDALVSVARMELPEKGWRPPRGSFNIKVTDREIWLIPEDPPLWRFDREAETWQRYALPEQMVSSPSYFTNPSISPSTLLDQPGGSSYLLFSTRENDRLYRFDAANDRFRPLSDSFPMDWQPKGIFPDEQGNLCFLFLDGAQENHAILQTREG